MGTDGQDEIEMVCRAKVDGEDWVFIRVRAGGVILGALIQNSLNYFCPKSGLGPELGWAERSDGASSCWKRRGAMGEDQYSERQSSLAFKKYLLGKDWKSSHIVMETPERSLLEIKVKKAKLY